MHNLAPSSSPRERSFLWHQLKALLPDGQWILLGDFNMTEDPRDSSGPSPLICGGQLETWRLLKTHFDLVDVFPLARIFIGTHFIQRAVHGHRLDQSQLDSFYLSDQGFWIHVVHRLEHVQNQTLSDHDPITLTIQLEPHNTLGSLKKTSYFKANPSILKCEGTLGALKTTWKAPSWDC